MMRSNLWLRTASRVLVRVARFRATAFFELERHARRIPWERFLTDGVAPEFRVTARKSRLYHSDAIAQRLAKAAGAGRERSVPSGAPAQLFVVRAFQDEFEISADSSGELLHLRGYRQALAKAPLRETLAAALILAAEWDGSEPLVDPFCGSGTIAIEGALLARRIAPGAHRDFAFARWPGHDAREWATLRAEAGRAALVRSPAPIIASDRDAGAIAAASANAARAGVSNDVELARRALSALEAPAMPGLVATNPPYGVRVSPGADVRNLYAQFGKVLRARCPGWKVALYVANSGLRAATGISLKPEFATSNGGIRVSAELGRVGGHGD